MLLIPVVNLDVDPPLALPIVQQREVITVHDIFTMPSNERDGQDKAFVELVLVVTRPA
jgi:hypothetical protein